MKNKSKEEIDNLKKQLAENQKKGFSRTALTNKFFIKWAQNESISRFGIDYQYIIDFNHINKFFSDKNLQLDIRYPYALIFV